MCLKETQIHQLTIFLGQNPDILCSLLRVSEGLNQGVVWGKLLSVGCVGKSTFKLIQVGQICFLVNIVLRFPFPCWLSVYSKCGNPLTRSSHVCLAFSPSFLVGKFCCRTRESRNATGLIFLSIGDGC